MLQAPRTWIRLLVSSGLMLSRAPLSPLSPSRHVLCRASLVTSTTCRQVAPGGLAAAPCMRTLEYSPLDTPCTCHCHSFNSRTPGMGKAVQCPILANHPGMAPWWKYPLKMLERLSKSNSRENHVHWSSAMVWLKSRVASACRGSPKYIRPTSPQVIPFSSESTCNSSRQSVA